MDSDAVSPRRLSLCLAGSLAVERCHILKSSSWSTLQAKGVGDTVCQFKRLVSSWVGRECRGKKNKKRSENVDKLGKSPAPSLLERLPLKPHIHN